jgi:hypothetical protein
MLETRRDPDENVADACDPDQLKRGTMLSLCFLSAASFFDR